MDPGPSGSPGATPGNPSPGSNPDPGIDNGPDPGIDPNVPPEDVTWTQRFSCEGPAAAAPASPRRIWRLSSAQYLNSLRGLYPTATAPSNPFDGLASGERYDNFAERSGLSGAVVDQVLRSSSTVGVQLGPILRSENPCLQSPDSGCIEQAFKGFMTRAYRRPPTSEELQAVVTLVADLVPLVRASAAVAYGVEAVVNSPNFLFRFELGDGAADSDGRVLLTPHEVAAALSYSILDGPPDPELFQAAEEGKLATRQEIFDQALRLLDKPEANLMLQRFVLEYAKFERATEIAKDSDTYDPDNPNLLKDKHHPDLLVEDTKAFVAEALADGAQGFITDLFAADWSMIRNKTRWSYNIDKGLSGEAKRRTFDDGTRAGVLTHPSFLTAYSTTDHNDAVGRGKFIAQDVLCSNLPDTLPNEVPPLPNDPTATMRERLSVHSNAQPACQTCHKVMDPIGLAFEAYDHVGRFRTEQHGKTLDVSGVVIGTDSDVDGPFSGPVELAQKLGASPVVEQCFIRHNFQYIFGRVDGPSDSCALQKAHLALRAAKGDPKAAIASLLSAHSFLYRK